MNRVTKRKPQDKKFELSFKTCNFNGQGLIKKHRAEMETKKRFESENSNMLQVMMYFQM
jgi:hypothetical protein